MELCVMFCRSAGEGGAVHAGAEQRREAVPADRRAADQDRRELPLRARQGESRQAQMKMSLDTGQGAVVVQRCAGTRLRLCSSHSMQISFNMLCSCSDFSSENMFVRPDLLSETQLARAKPER